MSIQNILLSIVRIGFVRDTIILLWRFEPWRRWRIRKYLKRTGESKLQIGCCKNVLKGWLNSDISLRCLHGIYLDAGKRFPFQDASFNYVYSEHLFEHLTYQQVINMLKESYRILKSGGVIRIATPDLRFLQALYQEPEKPLHQAYMEYAMKGMSMPSKAVYVISRFHTSWGHQIIYDRETLTELLEQAGFKDVCTCEVSKSKHLGLNGVEGHFKELPLEFDLLETMVLEATK